ncbi:hypothetical protein NL676_010828 [Syzygium grande]|nr:hypothetical protein NL676_010828 [Syzygium grande]
MEEAVSSSDTTIATDDWKSHSSSSSKSFFFDDAATFPSTFFARQSLGKVALFAANITLSTTSFAIAPLGSPWSKTHLSWTLLPFFTSWLLLPFDIAFPRLAIFIVSTDEIDPLVRQFVRDDLDGKVDPTQLKRLFMSTEPRFLVGFEDKVNLLIYGGIPSEKIVHVLNNVNLTKALSLKPFEEIERLINFLSRYGDGVDLIVRHPPILNFDMDGQLIPRVEFLLELSGGDEDATGAVLRILPTFLKYRVENVESHVEFLRSFTGLDDQEIFRIILVFPNIVGASKERKLRPRISFLQERGLNSSYNYADSCIVILMYLRVEKYKKSLQTRINRRTYLPSHGIIVPFK